MLTIKDSKRLCDSSAGILQRMVRGRHDASHVCSRPAITSPSPAPMASESICWSNLAHGFVSLIFFEFFFISHLICFITNLLYYSPC